MKFSRSPFACEHSTLLSVLWLFIFLLQVIIVSKLSFVLGRCSCRWHNMATKYTISTVQRLIASDFERSYRRFSFLSIHLLIDSFKSQTPCMRHLPVVRDGWRCGRSNFDIFNSGVWRTLPRKNQNSMRSKDSERYVYTALMIRKVFNFWVRRMQHVNGGLSAASPN